MSRKDAEALRKYFTEIADLISKELGVPVEIRDQGIVVRVGHLKRKKDTKGKHSNKVRQ